MRCGNKNEENAHSCANCGMSFTVETDILPEDELQKIGILEEKELRQTNRLLEEKIVTEIECSQDFFFVLSEGVSLSSTEYKVLNSIQNTGLLRCKKILYNGKTALYYCTESYTSLTNLLPTLDTGKFLIILENILNKISDIKENGFLSAAGLDLRINRIYVDSKEGEVFLTYLPLTERCCSSILYLEKQIREELAYLIRSVYQKQSGALSHLVQMLEEPACSFGNILSAIRQNRSVATNTGR